MSVLQARQAALPDSALTALMSGRYLAALGHVAGNTVRHALGMNEGVANVVGDYLMSTDPDKLRLLQAIFRDYTAAKTAPTLVPSAIAAGANAPRSRSRTP